MDQQRRTKLTRIGRPQRMPRQQRVRTSPNGKDLGHLVPLGGDPIQPFEDFASL